MRDLALQSKILEKLGNIPDGSMQVDDLLDGLIHSFLIDEELVYGLKIHQLHLLEQEELVLLELTKPSPQADWAGQVTITSNGYSAIHKGLGSWIYRSFPLEKD